MLFPFQHCHCQLRRAHTGYNLGTEADSPELAVLSTYSADHLVRLDSWRNQSIGWRCFSVLILFLQFACHPDGNDTQELLQIIETPSQSGGESNLFASTSGDLYLSWVEYADDTTDVLQFSKWEGDAWGETREIARGTDWFVNWADFPSLATFKGDEQKMVAHWLQKSAEGTYDYDVRIAQSADGGESWSESFVLHQDSVAAEHGFVSMVPLDKERMFATWLDGRYTKSDGPMTLRGGVFDQEGNIIRDTELDDRVCDCCQTSAVHTNRGLLIAYRDRSFDEIRDISIVGRRGGQWTPPRRIVDDHWEIAGCPVNGPALATNGDKVALAWYTAANDIPQLKLCISEDAGNNWSPPIRIDDQQALGRVDVAVLPNGDVLVTWLEYKPEAKNAEIRMRTIAADGTFGESQLLHITSDSRASGFPRLACVDADCYLSWTEADREDTRVMTARILH